VAVASQQDLARVGEPVRMGGDERGALGLAGMGARRLGHSVADGLLLEREPESEELEAALIEAAAGRGGLVLAEGPAGIGKTSLLALAGERGIASGMNVLWARGAELERDYGWGVVRQLFEQWVLGLDGTLRRRLLAGAAEPAGAALGLSDAGEVRGSFAAVHGLYWLVVNAAEGRPLVLVIDDLHWADEASLVWVAYLAARVARLPVLFVMAVRRPDPAGDREILRRLEVEPPARVLRLAPLTLAGTRELVMARPELSDEAGLGSACHAASGGNPFLLGALLDELSELASERPPDPAVVAGLRPEEISRSVLLRLGRLSGEARALARAVAVLGGSATTQRAGILAELSEAVAASAALAAVGILTDAAPPRFVHPVVHGVVLQDMLAPVRAQWHARAAVVLRQTGGELQEIAGQLLHAEPVADAAVSETLCDAARLALGQGAPQEAVVLLERAVREPPPNSECSLVHRLLGRALLQTRGAAGLTSLRRAVEVSHEPHKRVEAALELARALEGLSRNIEATDVYEQALREFSLPDENLSGTLEAGLAAAAAQNLSTLPRALELLAAAFSGEGAERAGNPMMQAVMALAATAAGLPQGVPMAQATLEHSELFDADTSIVIGLAVAPLVWGDRLDAALSAWDEVIARARARGAPLRYAFGVTFRAQVHLRAGRLVEAEADARAALEVPQEMWVKSVPVDTPSILAEVLIERGALDEAQELLESAGPANELPEYQGSNLLLMARGRLRLAQGKTVRAAEDLLELGRRCEAFTLRNPAAVPWRSLAALAIRQTDPERAVVLTDEEIEIARGFGAPRALGISLRAGGLVRQGAESTERLEEAVDVLSDSTAPLERARALVDLGAAQRRAGERGKARRNLADGLDAAAACGSVPLRDRARAELTAAGARPRRDRITTRDALTASELRTALMASEGKTNREIAEALWVTLSTVEAHLTRVYRKLDISQRSQLPQALQTAQIPE
jgi:DNA-binding CsgD family transcriptional regulator/tetratricopeptide (TPR) repeat protein